MSYLVRTSAPVSKWIILRREATLDLPFSSKPYTAIVDGIVTYDFSGDENIEELGFVALPSYHWCTTFGLPKQTVRPIIIVFEAKWSTHRYLQAACQIVMYKATAIHHRLAAGIDAEGDDCPIYSLTQAGSTLCLYTGHDISQEASEDRGRKQIVRLLLFLNP